MKKILNIAIKTANEGYELFSEIENDGRCNSELAHRYAIEMKKRRESSKNFISFLRLYDIPNGAKLNKTIAKKVLGIVTERKYANINLMRDMKNCLEAPLIPRYPRDF